MRCLPEIYGINQSRRERCPASGGTHGGEPLLSLHKATSEVASDYKKKKHVFKLQCSLFLLPSIFPSINVFSNKLALFI